VSRHAAPCPLCDGGTLAPTDQRVVLADVVRRWKAEAGVELDEDTRRRYAEPDDPALREVRLHRCEACRYAPFLPAVVGSEAFYEALAQLDDGYYVGARWEFERAARDLRAAGARSVLDVGCGSGHFLDHARAALPGARIAGFEFNARLAARARARGHEVASGISLPEPEALGGPFDTVCLFQVVEHVADPVAFLRAARRLVAPRGQLVVTVPNAAGPVRHFSTALTDIPPHHVSRWEESTFRLAARRLGVEVVDVAFEPLPEYLWDSYLPVMLERDWLSPGIVRRFRLARVVPPLLRGLRRLGVRRLHGVRGHALYVRLRPASSS
jgi:2-polyprenyl-3-methyl-5-hydroxy-6-metoxy-1,4-benzoquinol methylase